MSSRDCTRFLGRSVAQVDQAVLNNSVSGRRVLITGGGGSIGSTLAVQAAAAGAATIVLLDLSEQGLFWTYRQLTRTHGDRIRIVPVLGSVTDRSVLDKLIAGHGVDLVFHAAAYKHVDLVEKNHMAAVRNNVLGTKILIEASAGAGVARMVSISTDKAVNPANFMGLTKRAAERVVTSAAGNIRAASVRFGNVLGSSGSVLPIFERDWAERGSVEVRDTEASRYFLAKDEASRLILATAGMIEAREIFVLKVGEPVRILELARRYLRAKGCANPDKHIRFTSLLPGEKKTESLWSGIPPNATTHPGIGRLVERAPGPVSFDRLLDELDLAWERGDEDEAIGLVRALAGDGPI